MLTIAGCCSKPTLDVLFILSISAIFSPIVFVPDHICVYTQVFVRLFVTNSAPTQFTDSIRCSLPVYELATSLN